MVGFGIGTAGEEAKNAFHFEKTAVCWPRKFLFFDFGPLVWVFLRAGFGCDKIIHVKRTKVREEKISEEEL